MCLMKFLTTFFNLKEGLYYVNNYQFLVGKKYIKPKSKGVFDTMIKVFKSQKSLDKKNMLPSTGF